MNFLNLFKKQLKNNPITIIMFIFIFYISSLGLSVLVSTISKFSNEMTEYYDAFDDYTVAGSLVYSDGYYNNSDMIKALSTIKEDIKFRTSFESFKINSIDDRKVVISDSFKDTWDITYPILSGRFYTAEEIKKGEKVVLLGKNIAEKYLNNDTNKISIDNEIYKVIGIVGYNNKISAFDENIFIPLTSLSKMTLNGFESIFSRQIFLSGKYDFPVKEIFNLEKSLKKINNAISLDSIEKIKKDISGVSDGITVYSGEVVVIVICMLFAILNMILINYFWIKDRRFEIGIRKAFGIKDRHIAMLLLCEFLSVVMVSSILAMISQIGLSIFLKISESYSLEFNIYNFFIIIAFNIFISILVSLLPIIKAIKISPIEIVKGE